MSRFSASTPCPCRLRETAPPPYADCCAPWHQGLGKGVLAPSPLALMRSRYSAYALATHNNPQGHAMLDYLHATWHPSTAPGDLELSPTQWTGLHVLHTQASADAGVVEFVAHFKINGKAEKMHETSRFVREAGQWWYIDGDVNDSSGQTGLLRG